MERSHPTSDPRLSPTFPGIHTEIQRECFRRLRAPGSGRRAPDTGRMDSERTASPNPLLFDAGTPKKVGLFSSECLLLHSNSREIDVNLVFTGLYRDTPRSPCTSVIASSSDMLKTRFRGGADVKTPGNRADDSVTRWIFPRTCLFPSLTETCCLAWIIARSGSDLGAQPRHLRAVHVSHDLW